MVKKGVDNHPNSCKMVVVHNRERNTMTKVNLREAQEVIDSIKGQFFTVEFVKKDGSLRQMNCRKGVNKYLRGGKSTTFNNPDLVNVWDRQLKEYRCFSRSRLKEIRAGGKVYEVAEGEK